MQIHNPMVGAILFAAALLALGVTWAFMIFEPMDSRVLMLDAPGLMCDCVCEVVEPLP